MAVASFKEIHDGRDGDGESSKGRSIRRYTRVFRATTDSNYDDATVVKAYATCPREGSQYPYDPAAYCQKVRASNASFSKRVWIVTANYSTEREMSEDPLSDAAEIEWSTEQFQRPYIKDRDGKAVCNTAGDYYDPPVQGDDSRWTATCTKNVTDVPDWFMTKYKDAINEDVFVFDGLIIEEKTAKIQSIRLGKWQERNDIAFRLLTIVLHFNEDGWDREELDQGLRQKSAFPECPYRVPCINDDGTKVTSPVLLDGEGYQLEDPTLDNAVFNTHPIYNLKTFSILPFE